MKALKITTFVCALSVCLGICCIYAADALRLTFFYSPSCHACIKVKGAFMADIEKRFKDKIAIEYKDITQIENYRLLLSLKEHYRILGESRVPEIFLNGHYLVGEQEITSKLTGLIESALNEPAAGDAGTHSVMTDIISHFRSFTPLAVISAGLIDGVNPCAFAVIIFFISFLTLQGYRKKEIAVIGFFFVVAVFLAYLLIGLGLFNFLYRMRSFWQVARAINFSIGIVSIFLGVLALYDFSKFLRGKGAHEMTLQLPQGIKQKIHSVIGLHYRKSSLDPTKIQQADFIKLASSAFVSGFFISLLEAVCTGQVYLPTIIFVLKSTHLKIEAFSYLLLYNIVFVVPLLVIFLVALLGATSEQLSAMFRRHFLLIKMLMALLFLSLGFYLIWRA